MNDRDREWEQLYERLLELLSRLGKNEVSDDGDCWLVDDDWGGQLQKLCIVRPLFWTDHVRGALQGLLGSEFPNWGIMVVFEDGTERRGFILYADREEAEPEADTVEFLEPPRPKWALIYDRIRVALSQLGTEGVFIGSGDYWLIDQDTGEDRLVLAITSSAFWSDQVRNALRGALVGEFSTWSVLAIREYSSERSAVVIYNDREVEIATLGG